MCVSRVEEAQAQNEAPSAINRWPILAFSLHISFPVVYSVFFSVYGFVCVSLPPSLSHHSKFTSSLHQVSLSLLLYVPRLRIVSKRTNNKNAPNAENVCAEYASGPIVWPWPTRVLCAVYYTGSLVPPAKSLRSGMQECDSSTGQIPKMPSKISSLLQQTLARAHTSLFRHNRRGTDKPNRELKRILFELVGFCQYLSQMFERNAAAWWNPKRNPMTNSIISHTLTTWRETEP